MRIDKKKLLKLFVLTLLIVSLVFVNMEGGMAHPTTISVDPPQIVVPPCTNFSVYINIDSVTDLFAFEFKLGFDPTVLTCTDAVDGGFLVGGIPAKIINNTSGYVHFGVALLSPPGKTGGSPPPLARVDFHCEGLGSSDLHLYDTILWDSGMGDIPHDTADGWVDQKFFMYWKENFTDYAPSGMPDFDQRQDAWDNPPGSQVWSWCAPTATANSLWWMDSRYETSTTPPPPIKDTFPLVSNYGPWDDHHPNNVMPFIKHLAYLMDTDGNRTLQPHIGTWVQDMQTGIAQYLSWTGLNPQGDCNGDGVVDNADQTIITDAWMTSPGMGGWDMRADIFPSTVGWPAPGMADNIVDVNDLNLWSTFNGSVGMFYEQTVPAPEFYFVEDEVEKCEDVILVLGFYYGEDRSDYPYEYGSGHCVTVAGVNSTTRQIAISDPIQDNAEPPPQGTNGPGRVLPSPPHPHGPGPTYPLHNNATYVSQDIYNITWAPPLPYPANFTLVNYTSPQYPGIPPPIAVVEWAVIVSPLPQPPPPPSVGGVWIPVDKLALLAPYIALASTILFATAATAIYVKRVKHRKKKQ